MKIKTEYDDMVLHCREENIELIKTISLSPKTKYFIKIDYQKREEVRSWYTKAKKFTQEEKNLFNFYSAREQNRLLEIYGIDYFDIFKQHWKKDCDKVLFAKNKANFLEIVGIALDLITYDYEIATIEPAVINGRIFYEEGLNIEYQNISCNSWESMAKEYLPENGSRLAHLYELFLFYAWRITQGFWSLKYLTFSSQSIGVKFKFPEKTGTIYSGGFKDGQGNSLKVVTYGKENEDYLWIGRNCFTYQKNIPLAHTTFFHTHHIYRYHMYACVGIVVLTKVS